MTIEMIESEEFNQGTKIKVIGVGGGGGNAVAHMIERNVQGVEFLCANTDAQALARSGGHHHIQLGSTGLGAGGKPDKGKSAAEQADTSRLLRIPLITGMLASVSTLRRFVTMDLPGTSENPFWISKWVRVELMTST